MELTAAANEIFDGARVERTGAMIWLRASI
jgi:hypothetical protein